MTSSHLDLEQRIEDSLPARLRRPIDAIDSAVTTVLERYGITALRIALAVVFIWFGTLKVIGRSPVEDLVKDTIYFLPQDTFFIIIGVWEIIIGIGLLVPVALRLTLALFWLQMAGTFLSLIILPGRAFQDGNPLLLAVTGEFVIKNLVLIAAGLVIRSTVRRRAWTAEEGRGVSVHGRGGRSPFSGRALLHDAAHVAGFFLLALVASFFLVYWSYTRGLEPPNETSAASGAGSSTAYDRTGNTELYQFTDPLQGVRNPVSLDRMSPFLVAATVATEDPSFFSNPGVNFRGLARAAFENLTPFGPGFFSGSGGSSITQQLARNVYVDPAERSDRSLSRKLKETSIALELKRRYSNRQILEWYLNQVYYGHSAYGAEAAARLYFGKTAGDLTLAEAALLAGLPQAPGEYSPAVVENRDKAKARQLQVLDLMREHADDIKEIVSIQPEQFEAAKAQSLNYVATQFDVQAPHFVFFVEDQVAKMCAAGLFKPPKDISCDSVVGRGGLKITTTLDLNLQALGERIVEEELAKSEEKSNGHNGSLVAIHPETGQVLTYVGSRNYFRDDISGQVDIASSQQSHGSAMKVFTYLTAFQKGWTTSTYVQDEPLTLVSGDPSTQVNNWNSKYPGKITVRKALSESDNTAAARTVMEVGVDDMRATAHQLGITDLRENNCGPAITLGSCEVKLVDMTYAFSALANNGMMP